MECGDSRLAASALTPGPSPAISRERERGSLRVSSEQAVSDRREQRGSGWPGIQAGPRSASGRERCAHPHATEKSAVANRMLDGNAPDFPITRGLSARCPVLGRSSSEFEQAFARRLFPVRPPVAVPVPRAW